MARVHKQNALSSHVLEAALGDVALLEMHLDHATRETLGVDVDVERFLCDCKNERVTTQQVFQAVGWWIPI